MKKSKRKSHARRAARPRPARAPSFRNAAPPTPREKKAPDETPGARLSYALAGAGAAALAGTMIKREDWEPKYVAGALGIGGGLLAWRHPDKALQSIGLGVATAAGGQLALMVLDKKPADKTDDDTATKDGDKQSPGSMVTQTTAPSPRPANAAQALPPGALESALARAQARLALADSD